MIGLVDTSIIVDILRLVPPAVSWLSTKGKLGVPRVVWFELLEGAENKVDQQRSIRVIRRFETVEMQPDDLIWATDQMAKFHLSHNVDGYDCMIAAVAFRLQLPLYTLNLKHFTPLLGGLAQRPY